jgi:formylglycine-generating enzyme required for sulfatase activity
MGFALGQAKQWFSKRADDIPRADRQFIQQSDKAARRQRVRTQALVGVLVMALVAGLAAWWQQLLLKERIYMFLNVHALYTEQERALKPTDRFKECTDCPEMIVVPAGTFTMGSSTDSFKMGLSTPIDLYQERPPHDVKIATLFAVAKFELTFAEWDACWAQGGCEHAGDSGFGRGQQPVINVSWEEAKEYVRWLSRITGKTYRLLSEAEYEYVARAGSTTAYPWGDQIHLNGAAMANCDSCGSKWDSKQTAPVASFAPNAFGLYDMVGNVWEWTEDCWHDDYRGAPANGSAWIEGGDCTTRVVRGGAWHFSKDLLRSASRFWNTSEFRLSYLGFRVARTLTGEFKGEVQAKIATSVRETEQRQESAQHQFKDAALVLLLSLASQNCDRMATQFDSDVPVGVTAVNDVTSLSDSDLEESLSACLLALKIDPARRYATQAGRAYAARANRRAAAGDAENARGDMDQAVNEWRAAMDEGSGAAMNFLGAYYGGSFNTRALKFVTPDYPTALEYWIQGADAGNAKAVRNAGALLLSGGPDYPGVERNVAKAKALLLKAAQHGDMAAAVILGYALFKGDPPEIGKETTQGLVFLGRACAAGDPDAQRFFAVAANRRYTYFCPH